MGCTGCSSHKEGTLPKGCGDHGSCRSGGCNRLNTHNWLSMIPVADFSKPFPYVEVSFNHGSRKEFFVANNPLQYEKGDYVSVESSVGYDIGVVNITGELAKLQMKRKGVKENSKDIRKILHKSTPQEIQKMHESKKGEKEMMINARVIAKELQLDMKLAEVEIQADEKKATFYYTADDRVDFRELIRRYAATFKLKIEMKQIGMRQEAAKVGGIGSCGRELCCSTWLSDFKSVNTTAARYQNLSINQTKLSGQCGRLKCCLNYELDTYMDALRVFPNNADKLKTKDGIAFLQKKDIFKNLMWYSFDKSNKLFPLTIERVNEILQKNKNGEIPEELQIAEIKEKNTIESKTDYVDVVGQFTLKGLERAGKKKKHKRREEVKKQEEKQPQAKQPINKKESAHHQKQFQKNKTANKQIAKPKENKTPISKNSPKPKPPKGDKA